MNTNSNRSYKQYLQKPGRQNNNRQLYYCLLLIILTLLSCKVKDQKQEPKPGAKSSSGKRGFQVDSFQKHTSIQTTSYFTDTLTIDKKAAVFYQPDSLQLKKKMKEIGEGDFRAGMDDYIYYINASAEYLEKRGLSVIDAKNKKYLKFVLADKKTEFIKLDTLKELWGMYLFDPKNKPYYADITDIEQGYKNYFK